MHARIGHSDEGMWLGWMLHVLANRAGEIVAWDWSGGNVHDLTPVNGGPVAAGPFIHCQADECDGRCQLDFHKFWASAYWKGRWWWRVFSRLKSRLGQRALASVALYCLGF